MKIDPESWHYRLYCFMSQWTAAWRGVEDFHNEPRSYKRMIGLCPYMRMILIWGPLAILSNFIWILAVITTFFAFPAGINGLAGVSWLVGSIFIFGVAIYLLGKLKDLMSSREDARIKENLRRQDPDYEPPVTFWNVLVGYIKTFKTKICPVMELPND